MATEYAFGQIVTNGLATLLDAADKNSYPGSGTSWIDVSGNNRTGTLVNGPVFNSEDGGYILFDGTSDYVSLSNTAFSTNPFSISMWFKTDGVQSTNATLISVGTAAGATNWQIAFQSNILVFVANATAVGTTTYTANDTWVQFTAVRESTSTNGSKFYINGILNVSFTMADNFTDAAAYRIGINRGSTAWFKGNVANAQIYNRALSAGEVLQNYNAQKTRFEAISIVRSGLLLLLDSTDPGSYPGTGTSWTDLSGNGRTATMFGTVPFQSDVVNCFNFAGATGASSLTSTLGFTFASNMIPTTGNFTISCWIKNPNSGNGGQIGLFANAAGADGYRFGVGTTGVYYLIGPTYQEGNISFSSTLSTSLWYHVTAVYNRTGTTVSVYLNGVLQNSASIPAQSAFTNTTPGLVRSPCCGIYTGKLAVFSAYNRTLSADEILQNYNADKSKFGL